MERADLLRALDALLNKTVENGCTMEEAQAAAEKVNTLLAKYNIDLGEVRRDAKDRAAEEMAAVWPNDKGADGKTLHHWDDYKYPEEFDALCDAVGALNFCEVIDFTNGRHAFVGTKKDVELAVHMFESLVIKVRAQAKVEYKNWSEAQRIKRRNQAKFYRDMGMAPPEEDRSGHNHPTVWKQSWEGGAFDALAEKFRQAVRTRKQGDVQGVDPKDVTALVVMKDQVARDYAKTRFPVWYGLEKPKKEYHESKPYYYRRFNHDAYKDGHAKGGSISADPGLNAGKSSGKLDKGGK